MLENGEVSASDWFKGIGLSVLASMIGGASKLAIRKSWLIAEECYERNSSSIFESVSSSNNSIIHEQGIGGGSNSQCEDDDDDDDPTLEEPLSLDSTVPTTISETTNDSSNSRILLVGDNNNHRTTRTTRRWRRSRCFPYILRCSGMFGMSVLNPICCVLAMNYASPSILAPFSGLTLVWVILFSKPVVGETPSKAQLVAATLILAGELIVATFGDHTNDEGVTVQDVQKSYSDPLFISYFAGLCLYVCILLYCMYVSKSPTLRKFAFGNLGGSLTGLQNFLKDALTIIKATGPNESYPWFFWLFWILAGVSAFGGLLVLTVCMKRYDATYSAASFVGAFVVSASVMSAVHYKTFQDLDGIVDCILYPMGLFVLIIGVFGLVKAGKDRGAGEIIVTGDDDDMDEIQPNYGPVRKNSDADTTTQHSLPLLTYKWKTRNHVTTNGWFELRELGEQRRVAVGEPPPPRRHHRFVVSKEKPVSTIIEEEPVVSTIMETNFNDEDNSFDESIFD